jgi:hypothetical protein
VPLLHRTYAGNASDHRVLEDCLTGLGRLHDALDGAEGRTKPGARTLVRDGGSWGEQTELNLDVAGYYTITSLPLSTRGAEETLGHAADRGVMKPLKGILGKDFAGTLVTDFLSVYTDQGTWKNALCGAHVIREAKKIAELDPTPKTEEFRDRIRAFYKTGEKAQKSGDLYARRGARIRLGHLLGCADYVDNDEIVALQERLRVFQVGVTRFLDHPEVPWHNNGSEGDIRIVARHRVVTNGTRSRRGSEALGTWLSVIVTRRKNKLPLAPFIHAMWNARLLRGPAPSDRQ